MRTTVHDNSFVAKKTDKEIAITEAEINSMAAVAFLSADILGTYKWKN